MKFTPNSGREPLARLGKWGVRMAGFYGLICLFMVLFQRDMMYVPAGDTPPPQAIGLSGVEDITLPTPDGEQVQIWYDDAPEAAATVLYFHGNGGNIADRAQTMATYQQAGFGVALLSWRGYGNSSGHPTEAGLITDAQTAYDWLIAQGVAPDQIILAGESLGTGPAVQIAAQNEVAVLLLRAPYTATVDVAAEKFPWLPVRWLMRDQFRSRDYIAAVTVPIHISHGTVDDLIPYDQGRALAARAVAPVTFHTLEGRGHEIIFDRATTQQEISFLRGLGF